MSEKVFHVKVAVYEKEENEPISEEFLTLEEFLLQLGVISPALAKFILGEKDITLMNSNGRVCGSAQTMSHWMSIFGSRTALEKALRKLVKIYIDSQADIKYGEVSSFVGSNRWYELILPQHYR